MVKGRPSEVTELLLDWSGGDKDALNRIVPLVYGELRRLAAAYLRRERREHTLQPTGLVHEAYLNLIGQTHVECRSRMAFFGMAANIMRQILVNHAKRRLTAKRGAGETLTLESASANATEPPLDILALDIALEKLSQLDSRSARIVELRFFVGLSKEEIADLMGISLVTVKRDWRTAKAMLHNELIRSRRA